MKPDVLQIAHNQFVARYVSCFSTIKQMRIINVTERDATHGPVVLQLKKVVVYKYKKKEENICAWKPQGLLEEPQLSTRGH